MRRRWSFKRKGGMFLVAMVACGSLAATVAEHGALGSIDQNHFREVPVVMIVLDELPVATLMDESGKIDEDLFPNFARIQRDSTWFRNTTTPAAFTREAVPAILTGLYPNNIEPDRQSVFSLVSDAYEIPLTHEHHVLEPARNDHADEHSLRGVCPSGACENASRAMTELAYRHGRLFPDAHGDEFLRFLSFIRRDDQPSFYFLHYVMPHQPWRFFPSGQAYTETNSLPGQVNAPGPGKEWIDDRWLVAQAYQRHLLQTSLLDRQLGVLIEHLEAHDLYESSLIAIAADHGVAFEPEASKRVVEKETAGHISAVPFFIKEPFQEHGRISDRPLETIDVVPTLIDTLASSETPPATDGISAYSSDFPKRRVRETSGMPLPRDLASKFEVAQMKYDIFGRTEGRIDLFKLGPGRTRSFLGRKITDFEITAPSGAAVDVEKAKRVKTASPTLPLLPAFLEGTITGSDIRGRKVIVALNDTVVATTRSYRNPRGAQLVRFSALLPPDSFGSPPNDLDLYFLEDAASMKLTPLLGKISEPSFD